MIDLLLGIASHAVAVLFYPGLATMVAFGLLAELLWMRVSGNDWELPELPRRRPSPVSGIVALCAVVAAVQTAAPLNPVPGDERSIVLAAVGLAFTAWAELALTVEFVAEPGLMLLVQACWLLAVMGPAIQPESLRPQVLGNLLVPSLVPVKVACAFLYLLCLPALLRVWPFAPPGERRGRRRLDAERILTWFPYCALFTTLFVTPSSDDALGLLRFFAITIAVAAIVIVAGIALRFRGEEIVRGLYTRGVAPFAGVVVVVVLATSILMR
ncbi:MAG TPA: hypothetical protein VFK22_04445 [Candidatus Dormibacteraeota bacterium]|nr:hypothetical protein [Candidatus Dormibacteraeota bacterium]